MYVDTVLRHKVLKKTKQNKLSIVVYTLAIYITWHDATADTINI